MEQKKILFVEDDSIEREAYKHQLEKSGYIIAIAESGPQAMEKLENENFDLVLLDIIIPGFDGFHVLERLRKKPKTAATPVIVLTNLDDDKYLRRAMSLGSTEYLVKANAIPSVVTAHVKNLIG